MSTPNKEKKTPTPHYENSEKPKAVPVKKILKKSKRKYDRSAPKSVIKPQHRAVFEKFKEQNFVNFKRAVNRTGLFSPLTAQSTNQIKNTKSWQAIMKEYMPEEHVALRHSELLDKRDYRKITDNDGTVIEVDDGPNTAAVSKGVELAYRLRGAFKKEEVAPPSTVMYNMFYQPEVREQMRVFEEGLKKSLSNEINKKNLGEIKRDKEIKRLKESAGEGVEEIPEE